MYIGEYIKELRIKKNISAVTVYSGIMSRSAYEHFENGKSDTTVDKFQSILSRLNISVFETFNSLSSPYNDFGPIIVGKIHELFRKDSDMDKIIDLGNARVTFRRLDFKSKNDTINLSLYSKCLYYISLNELGHAMVYAAPLKVSLFEVETWGKVETLIFSDIMVFYDPERIYNVLIRLHQRLKKNEIISEEQFIELSLSALCVFIFHNNTFLQKKIFTIINEQFVESKINTSLKIRFNILVTAVQNPQKLSVLFRALNDLGLTQESNKYQRFIIDLIKHQKFHYI